MKRLVITLLLAASLPALADRLPLPANTPASFQAECGSCHLAYPPALLAAPEWRRIMGGLTDHFGSDAAVDAKKHAEISAFLERNAGDPRKIGRPGATPRISQTTRFIRKHHEIPAKFWKDPRIKSAATCEACHRGAADGRYSEHDIAIPELR